MKEAGRAQPVDTAEVDLQTCLPGLDVGKSASMENMWGGEGKNLVKCQPLASPGQRLRARRWEMETNDVTCLAGIRVSLGGRRTVCLPGRKEDCLSLGAAGLGCFHCPMAQRLHLQHGFANPAFIPNTCH